MSYLQTSSISPPSTVRKQNYSRLRSFSKIFNFWSSKSFWARIPSSNRSFTCLSCKYSSPLVLVEAAAERRWSMSLRLRFFSLRIAQPSRREEIFLLFAPFPLAVKDYKEGFRSLDGLDFSVLILEGLFLNLAELLDRDAGLLVHLEDTCLLDVPLLGTRLRPAFSR